ncbi:hypothetical protein POF73_39290 [Streptomyces sp. HD]|nr:hypothetical protein [Streptomyces sp. HD]
MGDAETSCIVTEAYPELPLYDVNARLPVKDVDAAYTQAELRLSRGTGKCDPSSASPVWRECEAISGSPEASVETVLWRDGEDMARELFARGAESLLTEDMTGRTSKGNAFRYRLTAVGYDGSDAAAKSPVFEIVKKCQPSKETLLGLDRFVLRKGGEPFLVAYQDGSRVLLIETRTGDSPSDRLPDTKSGLLPAKAVDMLGEWWRTQARKLL